ncbi:ECF transporter S component [Nocardioides currus]|uniref:ECF transporter S component n=1 Tax=Nocardioides currus TaxID=2133958 RepID=A0A2R7YWS5_9ACTN|nr:ECF transporter S component [Nocardioides currus]PUA80828.1 hypothetical protein C7S10_10470 [Nocardioides currus]
MEPDELVEELRAMRHGAGSPSFGDIAIGVSRVRRERGLTPEQARVGRTTVYDAFRLGRIRLDLELVADIVRALGGSEERALDLSTPGGRVVAPEVQSEGVPVEAGISWRFVAGVLVGCVVLNLAGRVLVDALALPVYLDMVGTAVTAIVLGPWWGALVGLSTNVVGAAPSGPESIPFALVNVAGALAWGYGARRWSLTRSIPRFFVLNVLVALTCSVVAVPILVLLDGGFNGHGTDQVTEAVLALSHSLWASVTVSNVLTSISDKLIAGFVALTVIEGLPRRLRAWAPDDWMGGPQEAPPAVRARSGTPDPV